MAANSGDKGGISWRELLADKSIDAILIPVGLFAALWFQGWVDERKEREDYASLVADFRTEVGNNLQKAKRLERDLGPITDTDDDKVLGPLEGRFEAFREDVTTLSAVFECLDLVFAVSARAPSPGADGAAPPPVSEAEAARLTECNTLFEAAEKDEQRPFQAIDLSPFYSYVVWQVYLSNGIKLFKDAEAKKVGLLLGEVYASPREVEQAVKEIETLFNDNLMRATGDLSALVAESHELLPEEGGAAEDFQMARPRLQEMSHESWQVRYQIDNLRTVVALKVTRLKEYMQAMNQRLDATIKALDAEKGRVGGA